jgi:hypothetical protein
MAFVQRKLPCGKQLPASATKVMKTIEIIQIVLFFALGIALTPPIGQFVTSRN